MIPKFPEFKKLEFDDKDELEAIVNKFEPYSDFNFVSLWSYDTEGNVEISKLQENLVVKFVDYITNETFLMFLGDNNSSKVWDELFEYVSSNNLLNELRLIPEVVARNADTRFEVIEDEDNHDYILSVEGLAIMSGGGYSEKRQFVNQFKKKHTDRYVIREIDLLSDSDKKKIVELFEKWEQIEGKIRNETERELKAVNKLLSAAEKLNLHCLGIEVDGQLVGFSIQEVIYGGYAILHFEKADTTYPGIYPFLKQQVAKALLEKEVKYLNYEQDLGIEGLKKAKKSYHPTHMLKKYKVRRR